MGRIVRIIIGSTVLLAGLAMLVLPGPAVIVVPLGLAILAIDFPWARVLMQNIQTWLNRKKRSTSDSPSRPNAKDLR
jgi:tellurite resistance protein TerC